MQSLLTFFKVSKVVGDYTIVIDADCAVQIDAVKVGTDYFSLTNPIDFTYDGWRWQNQPDHPDWDPAGDGQQGVPYGTWNVEAITIRNTTAAAAPAAPASADPIAEALNCLGFKTSQEFVTYFKMVGVDPAEVTLVPDGKGGHEKCALRVLREKDNNDYITPFIMTNPTNTTFDGWRASVQPEVSNWDGSQAKIPSGGPWSTEGVTIRPFTR